MKTLYHYPLCPFSRQVRIYLSEISVDFQLIKENYWEKNEKFLSINPAGNLPILIEPFNLVVCGIYPITEYLHEKYHNFNLMSQQINEKCEIRRLLSWFNDKFYHEVTKIFLNEKIIRPAYFNEGPRTDFLRIAKTNLNHHFNNLIHIIGQKGGFLALDSLTCSDIAAASHLSVLDYLGEINWDAFPVIAHWYALIKSRPSFKPLLQDNLPGFIPPKHYAELDF